MSKFLSHARQPDPVTQAKIDDLLASMTLEEKVGQLVMLSAFAPMDWDQAFREQKLAEQKGETYEFPIKVSPRIIEKIRKGEAGATISAERMVNHEIQRTARHESRLGIPMLIGHDVIHGLHTVFPIPLAESCTWNPDLLEQAARAAAIEASTVGIDWIFAPMIDIARDARWGRIAEGAGEDPCLGTAMALARVRGFQTDDLPVGHRIAACPKHYVGYGAAEAGRDYNSVELSERTLRDIYLPPFKAALAAGAGSVMSAFNEIAGVPGTCNTFLLRTVLRDEWGWNGVVVSDYNSIGELVQHGVAADLREAAKLSILAGVDLDMESGAYDQHLASLVRDGEVPVALVDEAVRRVLQLKFSLGLFEHAEFDTTLAKNTLMAPEFQALALAVAQQSLVLLKNDEQVLPLTAGQQRIALIGPLANNRADLLGMWSMASQAYAVETVLHGLAQYDAQVIYEQGCSIEGDDLNLTAAVQAAEQADVVVLVVGESAAMSGEAHSRVYLGLPGSQPALFDALVATGKPLITVLMSGRPLVIPQIAQKSAALLVAWHGGIRAGQAVADVLFGAVNPSGKLTASFPRAEGQIPVFYAHKATGRPAEGAGTTQFFEPFRSTYLDESNAPLFAFGEGLSYSRFEYSDLAVLTPVVARDGVLQVTATVHNASNRAGAEVVQLYVRDLVGSVTRPVKELKGFQRITLAADEQQMVRFEIPVSELGFHGLDMQYCVEPGAFKVWIGPDSTDGLEGAFTVTA